MRSNVTADGSYRKRRFKAAVSVEAETFTGTRATALGLADTSPIAMDWLLPIEAMEKQSAIKKRADRL